MQHQHCLIILFYVFVLWAKSYLLKQHKLLMLNRNNWKYLFGNNFKEHMMQHKMTHSISHLGWHSHSHSHSMNANFKQLRHITTVNICWLPKNIVCSHLSIAYNQKCKESVAFITVISFLHFSLLNSIHWMTCITAQKSRPSYLHRYTAVQHLLVVPSPRTLPYLLWVNLKSIQNHYEGSEATESWLFLCGKLWCKYKIRFHVTSQKCLLEYFLSWENYTKCTSLWDYAF